MRILDLYCGVGGASVGYNRAGFEVVGVDIDNKPCYPFPMHQGNVIDVLNVLIMGGKVMFGPYHYSLEDFDAIHASPPCQSSSALTKGTNAGKFDYPDLIPQTRNLLNETGLPYIIENVQGAEVRRDLTLCGDMFDLRVIRHRYFECSFPVIQPTHETDPRKHKGRVAGMRHGEWFEGPYFAVHGDGGGKGTIEQWRDAMDIHWINKDLTIKEQRRMIAQAIPPAYAEYVGAQLLAHLAS